MREYQRFQFIIFSVLVFAIFYFLMKAYKTVSPSSKMQSHLSRSLAEPINNGQSNLKKRQPTHPQTDRVRSKRLEPKPKPNSETFEEIDFAD